MKKILSILFISAMVCSCAITAPVAATNNPLGGKVGVSEGNIFKPATVSAAAKNGGVTSIATVDKKVYIFNIFGKYSYIVSGE